MFFSKFAESTGLFDLLAPIIPRSRNNGQEQEGQSASKKNKVDHEQIKRRQLDSQRKSEEVAESKGLFAKKQRVRYHNKTTDVVCDAVVVGVHFDDGPQHPYYTIKFKKQLEEELEDGSNKVEIVEVEKQTNPDRLTRVPWDEDLAWKVLQ